MDKRNWKKVLLQWVTECAFIEHNYFNIEQSDIEGFFQLFCKHHTKAGISAALNDPRKSLILFFKEFYPSFELQLNQGNDIHSDDYVYVYSLLLHFSCVQYPATYFHEICKKLPEQHQQCIALFFKNLMDSPTINKTALHYAIAECASAHITMWKNDSTSSTSPNTGSPRMPPTESPRKTPRRGVGTPLRISPSTPKSTMLEERTRELYNIRALLETERYEKGLLEVQIKQNEDKFSKLIQDHKKLQQQILALKNDILTRNCEITSQNRGDDQCKRRLIKEIALKEEEIAKLAEELGEVKEEKALAKKKLKYSEEQIFVLSSRIEDLDTKVLELMNDVDEKNQQIQYLTNSRNELEQFISETRTARGGGEDLNGTADCLDASYSRATNSSGSTCSPENLGISVVDMQLREKTKENCQLREELNGLRMCNNLLAKQMDRSASRYSSEFGLNMGSAPGHDEDFADPAEHFLAFLELVETISNMFKQETERCLNLEDNSKLLEEKNSSLSYRLDGLEQEMESLREKLDESERARSEMQNEMKSMDDTLAQRYNDLHTLEKQKEELSQNLDMVMTDMNAFRLNCQEHQIEYRSSLEKLSAELRSRDAEKCQLADSYASLKQQTEMLQEKSEKKIESLKEKLASHKRELEAMQSTGQMVKEKYEKLLIQCEELKNHKRTTSDHLESMRNELAVKEMEMGKLGTEIVDVRTKNVELEERINRLMAEYTSDKQSSSMAINQKDEHIKEINNERSKLQKELAALQYSLRQAQDDAEVGSDHIEAVCGMLNLPPVDEANLRDISQKVRDEIHALLEYKSQAAAKLKDLDRLEAALKKKTELLERNEKAFAEAKKALEESKKKIAKYEEDIAGWKAKMQKSEQLLQETKDYMTTNLRSLQEEVQRQNEKFADKERELKNTTEELHAVKEQLAQSEEQTNHHKLEYLQKIETFETKINTMAEENSRLIEDVATYKSEHSAIEKRLSEADAAIGELTAKLNEDSEIKDKLTLKLAKSQHMLQETEMRVASILTEKSHLAQNLEQLQEVKIKTLENQIEELEKMRLEHSESIVKMQQQMSAVSGEKEKLLQEITDYTVQLEAEQQEKTTLYASLEETATKLQAAVQQREMQATALEEQCAELREQLQLAEEQNSRMQIDLVSKEAELRVAQEEHQEWEAKLSKAQEELKNKSEAFDEQEEALIEILTTLENNLNITIESASLEGDRNMFKVEEVASSTNKLKVALNQLTQIMEDSQVAKEKDLQEAESLIDELSSTNKRIAMDVAAYKAECDNLQEILKNEVATVENRLTNEVKRLTEDLHNLVEVNDKLTDENANLQIKLSSLEEEAKAKHSAIEQLTAEKNRLVADVEATTKLVGETKAGHEKVSMLNREQEVKLDNLKEKIARVEEELREKANDLKNTSKDLQKANEDCMKSQYELGQAQERIVAVEAELKELNESYRLKENTIVKLESSLSVKEQDLSKAQSKIDELSSEVKGLETQLTAQSQKCDEALSQKLVCESKFELLNSQFMALTRDCEFLRTQLQGSGQEVERILRDVEDLKKEKLLLIEELKDNKRELQRANDNVTELIQQNGSVQMEKEAMSDENQLLRKQLEENRCNQTTSESKLKHIVESSQAFERKLLTAENDLKSLRNEMEKAQSLIEKLRAENSKAHEGHEAAVKKLEKIAVKLGDAQASVSKLERENEKLLKAAESQSATIEALQKEKDSLHNDIKALKERLLKAERAYEQNLERIHILERVNRTLEEAKQRLEASEHDVKAKVSKLEKLRETNEEKIRKLNHELSSSENAKVHLNLQIGALNSEICQLKSVESGAGGNGKTEDMAGKLREASGQAAKYKELCDNLQKETERLQDENSDIQDQLSKMQLSLEISRGKCEELAKEMDELRNQMAGLRSTKAELELDRDVILKKLKESEVQHDRVCGDQRQAEQQWAAKLEKLEATLNAKTQEISELKAEIEKVRRSDELKGEQANETVVLTQSLESAKLALEKETKICAQLRLDNQILQVKYKEAKERLSNESKLSEERIKDNRLELEGKLEKMKNKMKVLYTEEIAKMKSKQERETSNLKSEMEVLRSQNVKYEEHTKKLSSQIVQLSDKLLDQQKQNKILATKLKHLQDGQHEIVSFKRPNSIHIAGSAASGGAPNIGSNLAMEDEEGEVFNNTYLTDLKSGRISEFLGKDVWYDLINIAEELQYRNSLLPPHLKSTYASYDHGMAEEELKDGPHSLDDSMSALLSTTTGGTRKKLGGITHYKRPGPPTPSKHGGRLSFGGSTEPAREILRETFENNAGGMTPSTSKTPARFGFFASRFSMGKDEPIPCIEPQPKAATKNPLARVMKDARIGYSSTPRKPRTHYDQRRLLDEMVELSGSPAIATDTPRLKVRKSLVRCMPPAPPPPVAAANTPGSASSTKIIRSLQRRLRRRKKRRSNARPSLCYNTNVGAKYRTPPISLLRDLNRQKARKRRADNFNRYRMQATNDSPDTDSDSCVIINDQTYDLKNNNYANLNRNITVSYGAKGKHPHPFEVSQQDGEYSMSGEQFTFNYTDPSLDPEHKMGPFEEASSTYEKFAVLNNSEEQLDASYNNKVRYDASYNNKVRFDASYNNKVRFDVPHNNKVHINTENQVYFDVVKKEENVSVESVQEVMLCSEELESFGDGAHFEKLLTTTKSHAPFEVVPLRLSSASFTRNSLDENSPVDVKDTDILAAAAATAEPTPMHHLSRIIYGSAIIRNRRLPNINTTYVRKSSIYIKEEPSDSRMSRISHDVILLANQTITLRDFMHMWEQMSRPMRCVVGFALIAILAMVVDMFSALLALSNRLR